LKINFRKYGNGAQKIERGEFALQDSGTGKDIDLTKDWEFCFLPGQKVDMSMIFNRNQYGVIGNTNCPSCDNESSKDTQGSPDIAW